MAGWQRCRDVVSPLRARVGPWRPPMFFVMAPVAVVHAVSVLGTEWRGWQKRPTVTSVISDSVARAVGPGAVLRGGEDVGDHVRVPWTPGVSLLLRRPNLWPRLAVSRGLIVATALVWTVGVAPTTGGRPRACVRVVA